MTIFAKMVDFILYYLLGINILTFLVYGLDKWKARKNRWRIPEATLLMLAVIGGSVGALLGMCTFRHKTRQNKFRIGLPLILLAQLVILFLLIRSVPMVEQACHPHYRIIAKDIFESELKPLIDR